MKLKRFDATALTGKIIKPMISVNPKSGLITFNKAACEVLQLGLLGGYYSTRTRIDRRIGLSSHLPMMPPLNYVTTKIRYVSVRRPSLARCLNLWGFTPRPGLWWQLNPQKAIFTQ